MGARGEPAGGASVEGGGAMMRGARSGWRAGVGAVLAALILVIGAAAGAAPLSFTIGTSEPVVVDTTGGTPLIWL